MDELSPDPVSPATPETAGALLRAARERHGLSLAEVATRTRVPLRHLEAIEVNDYSGLPSPTYATGFAKAYARAVGADEVEVARGVRAELAGVTRPSRGLAIVALGLAVAIAVLAGLYFATGLFRGGTPAEIAATTPGPVVAVVPTPTPVAGGQVLVTATDEVWLRIYDADGKTLRQGIFKAGDRFEVPADATDPMINVGRPDKIRITLNGSQLQGLNLGADPIKDVRLSAAALQARAAGQPLPSAPTPPPSSQPAPNAAPATTDARPARTESAPARRPDRPEATPRAPALTETQRANLGAAPADPPPGNAQ